MLADLMAIGVPAERREMVADRLGDVSQQVAQEIFRRVMHMCAAGMSDDEIHAALEEAE